MDMIYDVSFEIPEEFVEECVEFRWLIWEKGGQQQDEQQMKKKDLEAVM